MRVIPKGWLKYQAMGEQVSGTKMVPFKVPLMEEVCCTKMPDDQWFTPAILLQRHPGLKMIIDLTDTTRYYDPQEFAKEGVAHVKIRITGGGTLPPLRKLRLFFRTVDDFMKKYANDPDALVGVHCTHGLNRTGYFICHYMVDRLDMSPDDAIAKFEAARGHSMHRLNYLHEIKNSKGKVTNSHDEVDGDADAKKCITYSSPLGDALQDYIDDHPRRGSYSRSGKTHDDWRRRDILGEPSTSSFRSFNNSLRTSRSFRYDDKNRHNREKHFSKSERNVGTAHPYNRDTSSANSALNWRDRS